ncbi:MAG: hypothetical protein ACRDP4_06890, partial [Nocardioidaceae bacterium]
RDALAMRVLGRQERALHRDDRPGYLSTWAPGVAAAQRQGATTYHNLAALRVTGLTTRYVAADPGGPSTAQRRKWGEKAWTADVDVSWRLAGVQRRAAHLTVRYTFTQRADRAYVVGIAPTADGRSPIWALGRLSVRRTHRTMAASTSAADTRRISGLLRQAVHDLDAVLPHWRGRLVSYLPGGQDEFDGLLGTSPGDYQGIAAVTTTIDGSSGPDSPVAIVLNPPVFDDLGPTGAHVVVTHEATHMATGAASVHLPLWVAEGFADYVGVGSVQVPTRVSAAAILKQIRAEGVPRRLPTPADFGTSTGKAEATYEASWLAMRMIAQRHGEQALVDFYRRMVAHPGDLHGALHDVLHTTKADLTQHWRRYLERLERHLR